MQTGKFLDYIEFLKCITMKENSVNENKYYFYLQYFAAPTFFVTADSFGHWFSRVDNSTQ